MTTFLTSRRPYIFSKTIFLSLNLQVPNSQVTRDGAEYFLSFFLPPYTTGNPSLDMCAVPLPSFPLANDVIPCMPVLSEGGTGGSS